MKNDKSRPEFDETKTSTKEEKPRRHRSRPTPKWLVEKKDLDEIAQRRCLLVLEVLSGARPVTDAIVESGVSRQTYYKLEERALRAMLTALSPAVGPDGTETGALEAALAKASDLEEKLATAEKDKRRSDRLSLAIRKMIKPGPLTTGLGHKRGPRRSRVSTSAGLGSSKGSTMAMTTSESVSTPTPAGANGR